MPYREDRDAAEARLASLEKRLNEIRAQASELADLRREEARVAAEVLAAKKTLADLETGRRRLPTVDTLRIASPCSARWEEMIGDDRVRFCGKCEKNVYNVSAMTRDEANLLLAEKEGSLCARMYQRADGTVITADCPVGVRKKRVRRVAALAIAGGGVAALASSFVTTRMGEPRPTQGDVAIEVAGGIKPMPPVTGSATPEPPPIPTTTAADPAVPLPHVKMGAVAPPQRARTK